MSEELDWQPDASLETLKKRAKFINTIRQFMADRDILEIETPILSKFGNTDPNISSLTTELSRPDQQGAKEYFLHTSPEFPMKRLLAAGSGPIFQICRVFRDDELSSLHMPEFTMLEWYRPGFDHHDLMSEINDLLELLAFPPANKMTFREVFQAATGLNPYETNRDSLEKEAKSRGLSSSDLAKQALFDFIISDILHKDAQVQSPVFIYDYPECMSALAKLSDSTPIVAKRFELIIKGIEIANGYDELIDPEEQKQRFENDLHKRLLAQGPEIPCDQSLLAAMQYGLPDMAGVALGLDRLFMLSQGMTNIKDVMAFSFLRS